MNSVYYLNPVVEYPSEHPIEKVVRKFQEELTHANRFSIAPAPFKDIWVLVA